jgi:hypothetical protein
VIIIPDVLEVPRPAGEESNTRSVESVLAPAFAERRLFEHCSGPAHTCVTSRVLSEASRPGTRGQCRLPSELVLWTAHTYEMVHKLGLSNRRPCPLDMDGCSVHVISGTVCTLGRVQDVDAGTTMVARPLGVMARQEDLIVWCSLQDPPTLPHGRWLVEERKRSRLVGRLPISWYVSCQPHREG